ncbi:MAG: hypothetical protein ACFFCZ_10855 [Promethearchaeota archaeon]
MSADLSFIPSAYRFFFTPLCENDIETLQLQMEFDQSSSKIDNPYILLFQACLKLFRDKKIRNKYFGYLACRFGLIINEFKEVRRLIQLNEKIKELLPIKANLLLNEAGYQEALEICEWFEKGFSFKEEIVYPYFESKFIKCQVFMVMGDLDKSKEELNEILEAIEYLKRHRPDYSVEYFEILSLTYLSHINLFLGDLELSEKQLLEAKENAYTNGNPELIGFGEQAHSILLNGIRHVNDAKRSLEKAIECYRQIGDYYMAATCQASLGLIEVEEGNIEEGIRNIEDNLQLFQEAGDYFNAAQFSILLATRVSLKGQKERAYQIAKKTESILDHVERFAPASLIGLARLFIEAKDIPLAEKYLQRASKHLEESYSLLVDSMLRVGRAELEFYKGNLELADTAFQEILNFAHKNNLPTAIIQSHFWFVRINFERSLLSAGSLADLYKAREHIESLRLLFRELETSEEINLLLIHSLLELMDLKVKEAENWVKEAEHKIKTQNWHALQSEVDDFRQNVLSLQDKVLEASKTSEQGILYSLEGIKLILTLKARSLLSGMKLSQIKPKEGAETKTSFKSLVILTPEGIPIFSYHWEASMAEDLLLSGFISAITDFSTFLAKKSEGQLQTISHKDYCILLEKTKSFIVALLVDTETYDARRRIKEFAKAIEGIEILSSDVALADQQLQTKFKEQYEEVFQ